MRLHYFAIGLLATAMASSAFAQQAAAPAAAASAAPAAAPAAAAAVSFMSNKDIMGLIDKAKADRKNDAPSVSEPILSLAPYRASLEYRAGTSAASVHKQDSEMFVILQGTGNIVTGGTLVDQKESNANNLSGSSISGGNTQAVAAGDMMFVPANTPHQIIPTGGQPIVDMSLHVPSVPTNWPPAK